jgi:hypothetical protein
MQLWPKIFTFSKAQQEGRFQQRFCRSSYADLNDCSTLLNANTSSAKKSPLSFLSQTGMAIKTPLARLAQRR